MNFYLYNNINLIAELLVVLPRVPLRIPSQQAIMMISRELGAKTKLSSRQGKIAERKRPREAQNEPMKEELAATGAPQNSKPKGNTTTDPSPPPIPSTSGTQQHISAPVNMLLTKEDRDMQFEISQEVLDELNDDLSLIHI